MMIQAVLTITKKLSVFQLRHQGNGNLPRGVLDGLGDPAVSPQLDRSDLDPMLPFIKTGELSYWHEAIDHAVVVVGLDDRYIYLNDPAFATAPIQVERDEFDLAWLDWGEKYAVFIQQD